MQLIDDPRQYRCQKNTSATYTAMMCLQHCVMTPMQQVCNCKYIGDGFAEMYASVSKDLK